MIDLLNYNLIGDFRVLHLLFVSPLVYIILYEMNTIYKKQRANEDIQPRMCATIRDVVGKDRSALHRLMFTNGDWAFINDPMGMEELTKMAKVNEVNELIGVKISYHTLKYNVIDRGTMKVI